METSSLNLRVIPQTKCPVLDNPLLSAQGQEAAEASN